MSQIAIIELLRVVYDKHQYRHLKPLSEGITLHAHTRFQHPPTHTLQSFAKSDLFPVYTGFLCMVAKILIDAKESPF